MSAFVKPALPAFYLTRSVNAPESPMLTRLRDERADTLEFVERTVEQANGDSRDLSDTEQETLTRSRTRVAALDKQIKPLAEFDALKRANADSSSRFRATGAPAGGGQGLGAQLTPRPFEYESAGHVLVDTIRSAIGDTDALARIESNGMHITDGHLTRAAAPLNTTVEIPGIMPKPIQGAILSDLDASRPFIQSVGPQDMGSIPGKSFSRPIITSHVSVAAQADELVELANRQFKIDGIDFSKVTRGGWAEISYQSIDWSAPSMWNALLTDFQDEYAIDSEGFAVGVFNTAVTLTGSIHLSTPVVPTFAEIVTALYTGAASVYAVRQQLAKLKIWQSVDQWSAYGAVIDATKAGNTNAKVEAGAFGGSMLDVPRLVVPALPAGTTIIGPADRFEVYENRIGFLQAISPKVLGIELAYGGNVAAGQLVTVGGVSPFFRITPGTGV